MVCVSKDMGLLTENWIIATGAGARYHYIYDYDGVLYTHGCGFICIYEVTEFQVKWTKWSVCGWHLIWWKG